MTAFAPIRHHDAANHSGFAILHGSFAPEGCVVGLEGFGQRSSSEAVAQPMPAFDSPARVFDADADAMAAIANGRIRSCDTIIIRHDDDAPAIDLAALTAALATAGLDRVTIITDGRAGGSTGAVIGHVAPSSAARGPIAYVQDDDIIHIDIAARRIDVLADIDMRRAAKVIRPGKVTFGAGALEKYNRLVGA